MNVNASSFERFAQKTKTVSRTIPAANRAGVRRAARETKDAVTAAGVARGWPKARKWVGYTFLGGDARMTAVVRLRGAPAYWAERGTKAHDITPRRRKKKKAVSTPYGPRARVHVSGARPRPFWHAGIAAAVPRVQRAIKEELTKSVQRVFS